uniref:Helicase n=1 Tax=viral metagenome TaxID=1070528 RepID=A0A6C0ES41_9ZZZZ
MRFNNETVKDSFHTYLDNAGLEKKEYQLDGVTWCVEREMGTMLDSQQVSQGKTQQFIRGGIVADEMGLGKTIMMLGICITNMMTKTLIVLPFGLLEQWWLQIYKTTGHKAIIYHGANKKKYDLEKLNKSVIVLTTYGAICGKINKVESTKKNKVIIENDLHKVKWNRVIFDEAHHLRNKNTLLFLSASRLKSNIRWFVTGTPVQNKLKDFYNLCLLIGLPISFIKENIDFILKKFVLKRSKKEVGILLPDVENVYKNVSWSETDHAVSREKLVSKKIHGMLEFSGVIDTVPIDDFNGTYKHLPDSVNNMAMAMVLLIRAKQSCISSKLLIKKAHAADRGKVTDTDAVAVEEDNKIMFSSNKINIVVDLIYSRILNGNGKIIFCDFHEEMDIIEKRLCLLQNNIKIGKIDARTKKNDRKELLNNPFDVLIIQINSGAEGLNLQENYSEIYFVSPHWNPSIEDQAIARCHRFGQKKTVSVFRFMMDGFDKENKTISVEQHISNVQNSKRELIIGLFQ